MRAPHSELASVAADLLERVRQRAPRVHCITNTVAQPFTANLLLAVGAAPSMTTAPGEIAAFVAGADALLVNLGTLDPDRRAAAEIAIEEATEEGVPWALDPVLIDRSEARRAFARALVPKGPRAIRLNAAEFTALAGRETDDESVARYAAETRAAIGLTGATDLVTDGSRRAEIANGDPLMSRVTAMGCAASALVAACLAVNGDAWHATAAGLIALGVAGELAAGPAHGPGSFAVGILDALHRLDRQTLLARARIA